MALDQGTRTRRANAGKDVVRTLREIERWRTWYPRHVEQAAEKVPRARLGWLHDILQVTDSLTYQILHAIMRARNSGLDNANSRLLMRVAWSVLSELPVVAEDYAACSAEVTLLNENERLARERYAQARR